MQTNSYDLLSPYECAAQISVFNGYEKGFAGKCLQEPGK